MYSSSKLPWPKINDFLIEVGNIREPKEFCVQVIKKIYPLIPYDQARIYFMTDYGQVYDDFLVGVEKRWSEAYLEYFSKIENGRYSIPTRRYAPLTRMEDGHYAPPKLDGGVYDWMHYTCDQFVNEYIKPQGIKYSAGFAFHSANSFMKSVYSLDRTGHSGFTQEETDILCILQTHLDNLHKNLFVLASTNSYTKNSAVQNLLTKRETEITDLLCRGITPIKISHRLCISLPTTYRHIANLHMKLNVSNRQELLLKLMELQAAGGKLE